MAAGTDTIARGTAMERIPVSDSAGTTETGTGSYADETAIVALAQRDPAAFAPLYQTYITPVYHYCYRRLGTREMAEDATSLVFERALRSLPLFRGGSFRSWLFAIAHNAVTDA